MRIGEPRLPQFTPGIFYTTPGLGTSTASPTLSRLRVSPFDNPRAARFDQIGTYVTVAAAGSTLRWVIYADGGKSYPTTLLLDTGAVGDASTVGFKTADISMVLGPRRYWLGCIVQSVDCTVRLHSGASAPGVGMGAADMQFGSSAIGYFTNSVTGAAPAAFPAIADASASSLGAQVWLRKA